MKTRIQGSKSSNRSNSSTRSHSLSTLRYASSGSLARLAAGVALTGTLLPSSASAQLVNPTSAFNITVDGQFTGSTVVAGKFQMGKEWSDITPVAFISPSSENGPLFTTNVGDPRANSLLFAGLDPGLDKIYLMYDYLPRTDPNFHDGDVAAKINFPVTLPANANFGSGGKRNISVEFLYALNTSIVTPQLNVVVHGDAQGGDPAFDVGAGSLGLEAALGFGPSPLSTISHMLVELSVPLRIPSNFGGGETVFPQSGVNPTSGLYSPDPQFWGSDLAKNAGDPPASAAIFQILPNGSTLITPTVPSVASNVPEPSGLIFLGSGLTALLTYRRRRRSRQ